jgi:hypothetical protein
MTGGHGGDRSGDESKKMLGAFYFKLSSTPCYKLVTQRQKTYRKHLGI